MTTLYGIKNCDTVKKARKWLEYHDIDYQFHDVRSDGLDGARLQAWMDELGWELLLNKRGTTWRNLDDEAKQDLDADKAHALMLAHPSLIKRPVLDVGTRCMLGFGAEHYANLFKIKGD